jgi:hypothetical protein
MTSRAKTCLVVSDAFIFTATSVLGSLLLKRLSLSADLIPVGKGIMAIAVSAADFVPLGAFLAF